MVTCPHQSAWPCSHLQNTQAGGPLKGALFWTWYAEGQRAPAEEQGGASGLFGELRCKCSSCCGTASQWACSCPAKCIGLLPCCSAKPLPTWLCMANPPRFCLCHTDPLHPGVFESDKQNWPIIQGFAQALSQLDGTPLATCASPQAADSLPPVPSCPSGYEGPSCSTDINECARGTAGCGPNAACTNTPGGYTCACYPGYSGDGRATCRADPAALAATSARYATDGTGKLACSEGGDVAYPDGAPGFAYDPTWGLSRPGVGGQPAQVCQAWACSHVRRAGDSGEESDTGWEQDAVSVCVPRPCKGGVIVLPV